jgi:hypothetical protein
MVAADCVTLIRIGPLEPSLDRDAAIRVRHEDNAFVLGPLLSRHSYYFLMTIWMPGEQ